MANPASLIMDSPDAYQHSSGFVQHLYLPDTGTDAYLWQTEHTLTSFNEISSKADICVGDMADRTINVPSGQLGNQVLDRGICKFDGQ